MVIIIIAPIIVIIIISILIIVVCLGTNNDNNSHTSPIPQNMVFVPCEGEYALCYYAQCKLNDDGYAECGCQEFEGTSFVDVTSIIPQDVKAETKEKCPNGLISCPHINQAPVCDYVNSGLTSTFSSGAPIFEFTGTQTCPSGPYANCMTAQCTKEKAWDGSPVTCTCPVEDSKHTIANNVGPCRLGDDIIWSGVPA